MQWAFKFLKGKLWNCFLKQLEKLSSPALSVLERWVFERALLFQSKKNQIIAGDKNCTTTTTATTTTTSTTTNLPYLFKNTMSDPFVLPKRTKMINPLLYADDFILSRSKTGLQNCLNALASLHIGWTWTLKVNPKKTKIIFQKRPRKSGDTNFKIGTEPIKIFQEFTYLCTRPSYNSEVWGMYTKQDFKKWVNSAIEKIISNSVNAT